MTNKLMNVEQNSIMANFVKTDDIVKDMCGIIESSRDFPDSVWKICKVVIVVTLCYIIVS